VNASSGYQRPGIAGTGAIATGLAICASAHGEVFLLARSDSSAARATNAIAGAGDQVEGGDASRVTVTTEVGDLALCDLVVEAVRENLELKSTLLGRLAEAARDADLATTTSSLSIAALAEASGHPDRVFGLHPFNPVPRMNLVELCVPGGARPGIGERAREWSEQLGKRVIEVPDQTGFVVNRLLFPYLFDAVRMLERTGMDACEVDECMTLGAGHPMGPLRLLDFVGLDVAQAIGNALHSDSGEPAHEPPGRLVELVGKGRLGRKSGEGFYDYSD
jgi:3-hydroxybutyryl-CoA dehydrogenase